MRARNIKPNLFKNELLGVADPMLTIVFAGLWCAADKEGRMEDRPLRLKAEILPYREGIDFNGYLTELSRLGFIRRYEVNGIKVVEVLNFKKHQNPHHTEKNSELPEYAENTDSCDTTVNSPLNTSYNPADSLIPDSLIPDSLSRGKTKKRFSPPSVEDVAAYCQERGNDIDAQYWIDSYSAKGWMVGKNKMKDWKAAIRTWEKNNFISNKTNGKKFKSRQEVNDEIQSIGDSIHEQTGFNPYRETEARDSSRDANQNRRALPE